MNVGARRWDGGAGSCILWILHQMFRSGCKDHDDDDDDDENENILW